MKPRPYSIAALSSALALAAFITARGADNAEENRYYNVKAGPVYITFNSSVETQYTDNVNLSNGTTNPRLSDLIVTPKVGFIATSQMQLLPEAETNRTTLSLSADLGYQDHLFRSELNRNMTNINVAPDSELSFLIHLGPVRVRLYDNISLQTDPVADGSLSNIAEFRRLTNTIGANARWNVNSLTTAQMDVSHRNLWALSLTSIDGAGNATSLNTADYDSAIDTVSGGISSRILSFLELGMNGSIQHASFPSAPEQDSTTTSYGPTATVTLTDYTSISANTGVTYFDPADGTGRSTSEYLNVSIVNKFNRYFTQTLSLGRQTSLDYLGSQNQVDYARYTFSWRMNSRLTITGGLGVDDTHYTSRTASWEDSGPYRLVHGDLGTSLQLSRKLQTRVAYRYTNKIADDPDSSYKQNMFTWDVTYSF